MTRILLPAVTTLLVVVSFLALSGWNRSGSPSQTITITERELPLMFADPSAAPGDDPGVQLRIDVEYREDPLDARTWLPEEKLQALGFALSVPIGSPEAREWYHRALPRIAWVALEYDGPAWREIDRRRALLETPRHGGRLATTRLVPVDAGLDPQVLRARYPTGHFIVRATIDLTYLAPDAGGPLVYGRIRQLHPSALTVPRALRDRVDDLAPRRPSAVDDAGAPMPPSPPRYEVDAAVGRLGIPYIRDIRPVR